MATNRMINTLTLLLGLPICFFGATDRFVGEWTGGGGLTKIQIQLSKSQLRLHVFGACHPQDCDWGEVDAQAYAPNVSASVRDTAEVISAQFVTSFSRTLLLVYPIGADQLRVEIFTVFADTSGRSPYHRTEVLKRAE